MTDWFKEDCRKDYPLWSCYIPEGKLYQQYSGDGDSNSGVAMVFVPSREFLAGVLADALLAVKATTEGDKKNTEL